MNFGVGTNRPHPVTYSEATLEEKQLRMYYSTVRLAMSVLSQTSELNLHTRRENQVENVIDRRPPRAGDQLLCDDYRRDYPAALHRPTSATRQYNCHGLTFASRRTWIWRPSEIRKILQEDDYERVDPEGVLPGDIVVYVHKGDVEHSGIVIAKGLPPLVLSKWGPAHEVLHRVNDCPYSAMQIVYYRIIR